MLLRAARVLLLLLIAVPLFAQEEMPEIVRSLMEEAARASDAGRMDEAAGKYEHVIELAPQLVSPYTNLGSLYYRQGKVEQAFAVFERGLERAPLDRTLLTNAATAAQQLGHSEDALALVDRALKKERRDAGLLAIRSTILRSLGRPADALAAIDQALEAAPGEAKSHFARGNLLYQAGRKQDAIDAYQRAISLDRTYLRAWFNLGAASFDLGRLEEALSAYQIALGPIDKAFARKETVDPANAPAYANLGAIYLKQKQWIAAGDAYQKALRLDPENASAHYNLGFIDYSSSEWEKAATEYQKALVLNPALPLAYLHLGLIRMRRGDPAGAAEILRRGMPHFDDDSRAPALRALARAEAARGDKGAAIAAYEELLQKDAGDVSGIVSLSRLYRQTQRLDDARTRMKTLPAGSVATGRVLLESALLAKAEGNRAEERAALEELLRVDHTPRAETWPLRMELALLAVRGGASEDLRALDTVIAAAHQAVTSRRCRYCASSSPFETGLLTT